MTQKTLNDKEEKMNNDENKTTNNIPLDLTSLPTDLTCNQQEIQVWLDSSPPLSDDEMKAMSAYFDSENFQHEEEILLRK